MMAKADAAIDAAASVGPLADSRPLGRATLPAQIHARLEEAIIRGEIPPGVRLHADAIAAQYGVSRIPVREALRSLHEAGWIEIRPRYGTYVRERSMNELQELFEARAGLEAHIAELAAERHTDDDLAQLRAAVSAGQDAAAANDIDGTAASSGRFNQVLRAAARNSVLASLSTALEKRARFYFAMVEDRLGADWVTLELELLALVAARDCDAAAEVARRHILDTGTAVSKLLSDQE